MEDIYFIDDYSQTMPTEDRARLFQFVVLSDMEGYKPYLSVPNLQKKLKYYFEVIREFFDTSGWPEKTVWEEEPEKRINETETMKQTAQ